MFRLPPCAGLCTLRASLAMLALASGAAGADPLAATSLTVYRGGTLPGWYLGQNIALHDSFDDGNPLLGPAFTGGSTATYTLFGAAPSALSESGGLLFLDPAQAQASPNAAGVPGRSMRLQLNTSTSDPARGLARGISFGAALEVSLAHLPGAGQTLGLRLSDGFSHNDDVVDLSVVGGAGGSLSVLMRRQDFVAGTVTTLQTAALTVPQGAATLALGFMHTQADSSAVQGAWGFLDAHNGFVGGLPTLSSASVDLFHGEDHTLLSVRATQAVPEPATWAMLAAGAALLARRRRRG